ncbi:MAG: family 16 glycosylhydrolase [Pseudonocardiales bacterium]|nr:family 16 glycosylhydrolase [Pseudonocardiales bacterium]
MNLDQIEDLLRRYLSAGIAVVVVLVSPVTGGGTAGPSTADVAAVRPGGDGEVDIVEATPRGTPAPDDPAADPWDRTPAGEDPDGTGDSSGDDSGYGTAGSNDNAGDSDDDSDTGTGTGTGDSDSATGDTGTGDNSTGESGTGESGTGPGDNTGTGDDSGGDAGTETDTETGSGPDNGDTSTGGDDNGTGESDTGDSTTGPPTDTAPDTTPDEAGEADDPAPAEASGAGSTTAAERFGWGTPVQAEEFSSTRLTGWTAYEGTGHDGRGRRSPDALTVRDGVLTITGDAEGTTGGLAWGGGQRYGRWEGRVRAPASDPSYNALLLLWPDADDFPVGGQVDFMEMLDPTRRTTDFFLHYGPDDDQVHSRVRVDGTAWHHWAVEWTPEAITGYVDGEEWFRSTDPATFPPGPMHLCVQLDWFPEGTGTVRESRMDVDWVRQYALDGAAEPDSGP